MLKDLLESQLEKPTSGCVVGNWTATLSDEEQTLLKKLAQKTGLNLTQLFFALSKETEIPFKMTAFKSHMRGACTCPKD
jgi:hypothetical protein